MTAYYKGKSNYKFTVLPPGMYDQTASQKVAQTYFTANKNVNVFATFGDQMAAGAMTAMKLVGSYTPGKNIAVIGYGGAKEFVALVKDGTAYATLGLYPASESRIGIQSLSDALAGKSVPNLVNIINPDTHPAIIDQAFLKAHPDFCAGIDTWWDEPKPGQPFRPRLPFLSLPNVIGSPHNSGIVPGMTSVSATAAAENVAAYFRGDHVRGIQDPADYAAAGS